MICSYSLRCYSLSLALFSELMGTMPLRASSTERWLSASRHLWWAGDQSIWAVETADARSSTGNKTLARISQQHWVTERPGHAVCWRKTETGPRTCLEPSPLLTCYCDPVPCGFLRWEQVTARSCGPSWALQGPVAFHR